MLRKNQTQSERSQSNTPEAATGNPEAERRMAEVEAPSSSPDRMSEPWIPLDHSGPTSILFGLELGFGVGFSHSWCNPEYATAKDCHPTNENTP